MSKPDSDSDFEEELSNVLAKQLEDEVEECKQKEKESCGGVETSEGSAAARLEELVRSSEEFNRLNAQMETLGKDSFTKVRARVMEGELENDIRNAMQREDEEGEDDVMEDEEEEEERRKMAVHMDKMGKVMQKVKEMEERMKVEKEMSAKKERRSLEFPTPKKGEATEGNAETGGDSSNPQMAAQELAIRNKMRKVSRIRVDLPKKTEKLEGMQRAMRQEKEKANEMAKEIDLQYLKVSEKEKELAASMKNLIQTKQRLESELEKSAADQDKERHSKITKQLEEQTDMVNQLEAEVKEAKLQQQELTKTEEQLKDLRENVVQMKEAIQEEMEKLVGMKHEMEREMEDVVGLEVAMKQGGKGIAAKDGKDETGGEQQKTKEDGGVMDETDKEERTNNLEQVGGNIVWIAVKGVLAGFGIMAACAVFFSLVLFILLLFTAGESPNSPAVATLAEAPPAVLQHFQRGMHVKVASEWQHGGLKVFVQDMGNRHAQETVMLLHGYGTSSFIWRKLMPLLSDRGFRVVALDLPGSGLSDKPAMGGGSSGMYSASSLAGAVVGVCSVLGLPPVHLVAHDQGAGALAAVIMHDHSHRLRSLHLMDAPLQSSAAASLPLWLARFPPTARMLPSLPVSLHHSYINRCCSYTATAEDSAAHLFLAAHQFGLEALAAQLDSALNTQAIRQALASRGQGKEGALPIQLLWAVEGSGASRRAAEQKYIQDNLDLLQEHEFGEGVGVWAQEDAPEETAEALSAFIDTLPPTPRSKGNNEEIPEHVRRRFEEMERSGETHAGCGHDHGGGGGGGGGGHHGHSHSHGGGGHHGHSH